ncbi:error-prone DNA polymerase [Rhizobium oryzicola]|uniref:Error-prone DNA polymerase n=1 Tax=Rhizobium oryzicola TaxID=1232668 RepID=A0ABT8T3N6_9HYPH|nr:error-prone DNA polymerase [Rhizobium oryzicola]MDO1584796.1 error-prone DNA polymerase [Rhizobium oryzicola]
MKPEDPPFCEIGARTNFSFLEGASHPEEMVEEASKLGLHGLGIADRNTVAGVVRAHAKLRDMKAKTNLRVQPGARLVFADDTPDMLAFPIDRQGWGHLCRLLSQGNLRTEKGNCLLYRDDLLEWGDQMMLALLPGRNLLANGQARESFPDLLSRLKSRFGARFYLGLAPEYDGRDAFAFASFAQWAQATSIPLIATNQPLYHDRKRRPLADVVTAIREHVTAQEAGFRFAANGERYLKTSEKLEPVFRQYPQAISNSLRFFSQLKFSLDELEHNYPEEKHKGETPSDTLERLTYEGALKRFGGKISEDVERQIREELQLIRDKQYAPYFLTVHRIMEFARSQNILCQGRGSAANSTVCYCLGITDVNPAKHKLLFARFLSSERDEPPDIDVDFEHARREEVIQFIYSTYGKEHAGLAAAVTSYRTRSSGREVAKAFGLSEDVQSALSSTVWGWSTEGISDRDARNAGLDMRDPTTRQVLGYARELMNFPRHLTQHVGGFVMTRDRLDEVVPIMPTAMPGRYMIEWNKDDLDTLNLLKVDVLALGMLTCLAKAFRLLDDHYGLQKDLAGIIGEQRSDVYDMICRADTIGVFQIESRAQMSMLPRLRPREFYDLVIEVAIVRPGPIQGNMVHPYLKRREEKRLYGKEVTYPKHELKDVLERTLGVPLFQEQAMQIAIVAAKFSPSEADKLRRAMATFKRTGKVHTFRDRMVGNMVERGYEREFAERCFSQIEGFGEYGFPESHAASFALLVYVSCWFKALYPDVFLAAILNSQPMGFYAPAQLVRDAREHGIEVLPVDVNFSDWDAVLEKGNGFDGRSMAPQHRSMSKVIQAQKSVRLGFRLVKGLAEAEIRQKLVAARGKGYRSIRDLWLRSGLNRATIEKLADADAFRSMGLDRRQALWAVKALDAKSASESLPLFERTGHEDLQDEPAMDLPEMPPGEQVIEDYRSLTLSLKAHPVSFLRAELQGRAMVTTAALRTAEKNRRVEVAGLVLIRQRPGTAKVIFMTLEDETGVANVIVRPKIFANYRAVVMAARLVRIRGLLQRESDVIHVIADHIEDLTPMLGLLQAEKRRFGVCERADEVLRATLDHREQLVRRKAAAERSAPAPSPGLFDDNARVLPRGRNFH